MVIVWVSETVERIEDTVVSGFSGWCALMARAAPRRTMIKEYCILLKERVYFQDLQM